MVLDTPPHLPKSWLQKIKLLTTIIYLKILQPKELCHQKFQNLAIRDSQIIFFVFSKKMRSYVFLRILRINVFSKRHQDYGTENMAILPPAELQIYEDLHILSLTKIDKQGVPEQNWRQPNDCGITPHQIRSAWLGSNVPVEMQSVKNCFLFC